MRQRHARALRPRVLALPVSLVHARLLTLLLALFLALVPRLAASQPGRLAIGADADFYDLSPHFTYFEDPQGELRIGDVVQPAQQRRFVPVPYRGPGANFGLTRAAIWLRIELEAAAGIAPDWLIEVAYPPLDRVELYAPLPGGGFTMQAGGDLLAFAHRAVPHRNHVLPVSLPAGRETTLYMRIQSEGTVSAPTRLWRPAALWKNDQATYAALSLYFGLLAGLLLYNLLLFLSVGDVGYLIYVAFAASMGIGLAALTGIGYQFLWPGQLWWNSISPPVGMTAAALFGLMFARNFLSSAVRMPRLDRVLLALMVGWTVTLGVAFGLPYRYSSWMVTVLAVISVAAMVVVGVLSVRRGFAGARFFFTAWALLLAGVFTLFLHNTGTIPSNLFTTNALLIGSALEMVLLSFALADRINVARRFKEQAQARIAAEHAMVRVLEESQERLRGVLGEREAILNSAPVGIVLSVNRRHEWVNDRFAHMLGLPREALIGQTSAYIHPDIDSWERFGVQARAALIATGSYVCEKELRRANGELFWVEMGGSCVRPNDPDSGVIWTFLDITDRKKSEAEMREALEQQKALNELRTRFVAMTSHEFRTPLAAILSAEELLRHYGERLPQAERLEILDSISAGVQRMSRMMDRVLLLGRADAQMLDFEPKTVDLPALCRQLVDEARAEDVYRRCDVVAECGPGVGEGQYDEKLLRHIFGNLLANAIKYSPQGGEVRFSVRRDGEGVTVFEVSDQGIGIPAEEIAHLFESFHRASNVGAIPGTGLGLAIVKNAVQIHGGSIEVDSRVGEGTRFTVKVPG
ncbi:MAG TPA: 7TM diverse intracellular signaling domain-containing protein [Ramlibacter sp.]|uniref:7TM diverse intracellular signaling domain-containing protein n=1 Tax=Ramlibacter sp. TaxID=1917967 RepID=UPI002CC355BC|nr:7TM diverse intracellular signaling domain-containing protein [Ramlibacter sp.]HVZ43143.1 7TM diverse intracellular signaling domain-containing protein [Ramlibacter sp.]